MSYVYKNITNQPHLIAVMNEARTDVSHIPLAPGARIEVSDTSLDNYMPHILARLNEAGTDITHIILRQKEQQKQADAAAAIRLAEASAPKVADSSTFSVPGANLPPAASVKVITAPAPKVEKKVEAKEKATGKVDTSKKV